MISWAPAQLSRHCESPVGDRSSGPSRRRTLSVTWGPGVGNCVKHSSSLFHISTSPEVGGKYSDSHFKNRPDTASPSRLHSKQQSRRHTQVWLQCIHLGHCTVWVPDRQNGHPLETVQEQSWISGPTTDPHFHTRTDIFLRSLDDSPVRTLQHGKPGQTPPKFPPQFQCSSTRHQTPWATPVCSPI